MLRFLSGLVAALALAMGCAVVNPTADAEKLLEAGKYVEALAPLRTIVAEDQDCAHCLFLLGIAEYGAADATEGLGPNDTRESLLFRARSDFDSAFRLDPTLARAPVYGALLAGRDNPEAPGVMARLEAIPEADRVTMRTLLASLYTRAKQKDLATAADNEAAAVAGTPEWKPAFSTDNIGVGTLLVTARETEANCDAPAGLIMFHEGEILSGNSIDGALASFSYEYTKSRMGWMPLRAWQDRPNWGKRRYVYYTKYAAEPYVFQNPPKCGGPSNEHQAWLWLASNVSNRMLDFLERQSVRSTGRKLTTSRYSSMGQCNLPGWGMDWVEVEYTQRWWLQCRVPSKDVTLGVGDQDSDRGRMDMLKAAPWSPTVKDHLLHGRLTPGLTPGVVPAAVGPIYQSRLVLTPTKVLETYQSSVQNGIVLEFQDGRLISHKYDPAQEPGEDEGEYEDGDWGGSGD